MLCRSAAVGFGGGKLVCALPGALHFPGRTHLGLECTVTGESLELSAAAGELILALHRDLGAVGRDLALERTPVTTALAMIVDKVAVLAAFAPDEVRDTPVGDG